MRYLVVTDSDTDAELREAILHLRVKQKQAVIPSTAREIADEIDELLDRLAPTVG